MGEAKNDRKRSHTEAEALDPASFEDRDNGDVKSKTAKRARTEDRRSLFVRSLPPGATSESLTDFFSQHYPVKHATVVVDQKTKESRGYGFVTLADAEDAAEAKKSLNNQDWNGRRIRIDVAEPRQRNNTTGEIPAHKARKEEIQRPNKLIVRNLPWSIKTSEQLNHLFRSFGKVKFADLPQDKGKLKGFGFVTLRGRPNAERALEAINGKEIDGRTLAVDWAVDKDTWDKQQPEEEKKKTKTKAKKEQAKKDEEEDEDDLTSSDGSEDEDGEDEDEDEEDKEEGGAEVNRDDQLDADLKNFFKNHMENLEDEDDEDEDEDNEDEDDEDDEEIEKELQIQAPKRMTDNTSTVFIRNLPFTTTDEQLKDFFGHFGKIRYARVVIDKVTEKPAGTGFVCFFDADEAKSCIKNAPRPQAPVAVSGAKTSILQDESADPDGKYTLDGRLLQIAQAVNKQEATNLADNSLAKRNEKDKRKLFLLSEGAIDRSSPLFNLLTAPEMQLREASAAQRKKLVQGNPSLHLSLTRLALRNIPRNMDSKDLKELGRKAVVEFARDVRAGRRQPLSKEENARDGKDAREKEHERKAKGKGIIRQAKIVFESGQGQKMSEKDGGKSRGYGFIEYTSHHWALMGLRYLNAHQLENEVGKKQRLIAEFAIENAQVIQRRRANEERSRQLNPEHNKGAKTEGQFKTNAQYTKDDKKRARQGDRADRGGKGDRGGRGGKGDRGSKGDRGRKGDTAGKKVDSKPAEKEAGQKTDSQEDKDLKHRMIQRSRVMRKKKALGRAGK
jgi:nucleolar protein 4